MSSDRTLRGLLLILTSLFWIACSVREDRTDCPCLLGLDFTALDASSLSAAGYGELSWAVRTGDFCLAGRIPLDELPSEHWIEVPREALSVSVMAGDEGLYDPSGTLLIPEGSPCPRLLCFSAEADGSLPEVKVPVVLHKRFARLDVDLGDLVQDGTTFSLIGGVEGYGPGFDPLPGPFRVPMLPDGEGWCHTAVPAQRDGSLCLCVYRFGELERIFSLGEYILDSGYDWQAEELEDIRMEIDYVLGAVRFKVEQWSKTLYFFVAV